MNKHAKETQYEKFVRVSRELQSDESEEKFDKALKKIAKAPAKPDEGEKPKE